MSTAEAGCSPLLPSSIPRRTPDHPPYAEMIQAAILALAEDGGSSLAAIDEYIKSEYHDLPWGHRNLFPHYLRKLIAVGEIQEPNPGRFVIAPVLLANHPPSKTADPTDQVSPPPTPHSTPQFELEPPSALEDSPLLPLPPPPAQAPECVSRRKRGRPRKEEMVGVAGHVEVTPAVEPEAVGVEEKKVPERRGRPKKKVAVAISGESPPLAVISGSLSLPRRRGRPPKKKPRTQGSGVCLQIIASPPVGSSPATPKRRGRGRPPKAKVMVATGEEQIGLDSGYNSMEGSLQLYVENSGGK